ncbi:2,3,4,5-tetrahydropyridine-2,6-dicarboxylate N-succinyltransferase [Hahella sp. CCB-MM4]|uniref:2,3,4,5-tetrahydropyridine-2,6-dicarboxylate N-succinyltransferase n=1 Tax=Hahella sp. (strain CCB-MM4) TaxID=1926491 RepID=UPI000B9BE25A|nr:2,3,4,5-tetrahydropyridine-2,6-dicarboxylate N-succinyltransferase [Hahella sp. CCB-MM4]OZG70488.1 2,3,4,5-tetrahydropyridine-2,6-dicarboxylate N-succinyltransferase [Hahella sp. CCB-MM4]
MLAFGLGVGTKNSKGDWLEVFYAQPSWTPSAAIAELVGSLLSGQGNRTLEPDNQQLSQLAEKLEGVDAEQAQIAKALQNSARPVVITVIEEDSKASSTPEVYLKLQLISHRLVKPHGINLEGIFGLLPNVAWTNEGAVDLEELSARQLAARAKGGSLQVNSVDKFPKMTDYVVPKGVRIADTSRVRLGAYIGEGTTIMHEGFVNFNAGTEGTSMIEGRISAGVMIGEGSDLGGGCSTMGTLSGGGNIIISVGKNSLIGANAGIGIPLGDRCRIEAGLYITAGTKVAVIDDSGNVVDTVKARELAGQHDLLFRRNSVSGRVEVVTNKSAIQLNEALHANN